MVLLRLWFLLLSIALFCLWTEFFINNIFFGQKRKTKKRERKRNAFQETKWRAFVKVCSKKYYPKRSVGVEIFFESNPQGLTFTNDRNELFLHSLFLSLTEKCRFLNSQCSYSSKLTAIHRKSSPTGLINNCYSTLLGVGGRGLCVGEAEKQSR